jgi:MHS family alpha-ketoglutarate permease-like MFS transporter
MEYRRECLVVVGLTMGGTVAFYTYTTYLQKFMINTSGIDKVTVSWINFLALCGFLLLQPAVGLLSDRIGRRPLLLGFGLAGTLGTVPLLMVLAHTSQPLAAFGLMFMALSAVSCYTSVNAVVKAELFPTHIRALGVGLPFALTAAVFGGTVEYVALWLKQAGHESWFYWYVAGCCLVSLVVYTVMPETSRRSRLDDGGRTRGHRVTYRSSASRGRSSASAGEPVSTRPRHAGSGRERFRTSSSMTEST